MRHLGIVRDGLVVSIHAPAWGATLSPIGSFGRIGVSIHAPAWGATDGRFQGRGEAGVSIHAPAWGATRCRARVLRAVRVSIHAPAWGATTVYAGRNNTKGGFNSRSRVGSDLRSKRVSAFSARFNSRSRVGSDTHGIRCSSHPLVSIHAPAWGATSPPRQAREGPDSFNSRSRVGSDNHCQDIASFPGCFNSRSRVGSDTNKVAASIALEVSIHAPAWGATGRPPFRGFG